MDIPFFVLVVIKMVGNMRDAYEEAKIQLPRDWRSEGL
jgi:hypothetical protein